MFEIKNYHQKISRNILSVNSGGSSISYNLVTGPHGKILDAPPVQFSSFSCSFHGPPIELTFSLGNPGTALKYLLFCYRPQQQLREGNVFTSVCQEFCPRGGGRRPPPRILRDAVNERAVRILLECILVSLLLIVLGDDFN